MDGVQITQRAARAARVARVARPDCQVLVVGAGPTGLVLAAELLARGVSARIIDKGDGAALETRALTIHARTLEVFDLMGLAERFVDHGQIVRGFRFYSDGKHLLNLDLSRNGSRFGFMLDIPQHETERLLRARVSELGGVIEQGCELVGVTDEVSGVTARVRDRTGRARVITAGFVVGCDGAHSRVRHELGLPFEGHPYPQDWLLADVRLDWARRDDEVHAFFRANGTPLICFPMRDHRWRLVVPYAGDRDYGRPPALEEIQQLVDERAPERVAVSDPTWLASFRCHRRSTHVYRRGHVLVAGDAVHIHTPAGGQGMNTGIMDAHNLGWKLALVAAGRSPEQLLDTYGGERAPVAAQVLALTHALVRFGTMSHPLQRRLRNVIVPAAARVGVIQRRAVRRWTQMHVAYPTSSLTWPDRRRGWRDLGRAWGALGRLRGALGGSWLGWGRGRPGGGRGRSDLGRGWPAGRRGWPKPGQRAPDIEVLALEGTMRLFAVLRRGRHVLVVTGKDPGSVRECPALKPYRDLFEVVTSGSGPARLSPSGSSGARLSPSGSSGARLSPSGSGPARVPGRRLLGGRFPGGRFPSGRAEPVFLVRPDGYVAARGRQDRIDTILGYLRQLTGETRPAVTGAVRA